MAAIQIIEQPGNKAVASIDGTDKEITELLFNVADRSEKFSLPLLTAAFVYLKIRGKSLTDLETFVGKQSQEIADYIIRNRKQKM